MEGRQETLATHQKGGSVCSPIGLSCVRAFRLAAMGTTSYREAQSAHEDPMTRDGTAYLDLADPAYSVRAKEVRQARDANWYAHTPYGLAILRHAEMGQLLVHPSLRQGSHAWPAHCGVHDGLFAAWWSNSILVTEGGRSLPSAARREPRLLPQGRARADARVRADHERSDRRLCG